MKLIIQIPCYNEEKTLGIALAQLPRSVPGFTEVEWLVIANDESLAGSHAPTARASDTRSRTWM